MAKRKHRGSGTGFGERLVTVFFVAFLAIVAVVFSVQFGNVRRLQARYEQEYAALIDTSWVDTEHSLSWIAGRYIFHSDEDGAAQETERQIFLQTTSFDGQFSEQIIPNALMDDDGDAMLIPADDPRGFLVALHVGDSWTLCSAGDGGEILPVYTKIAKTIREIYACYDGKVYGNVRRNGTGYFASVDLESGDEYLYRDYAVCLAPDGRAVLMECCATESIIHTDANGKKRAFEYESGWTLGIESPEDGWTPILLVGEDSEFRRVRCVTWLEDDLIFFAWEAEGDCVLYRYEASSGEILPFLDANGGKIYAKDALMEDSMTVSPDGRYIAYRSEDSSGYEKANIIVQSLETGRASQLETNQGEGRYFLPYDGISMWNQ